MGGIVGRQSSSKDVHEAIYDKAINDALRVQRAALKLVRSGIQTHALAVPWRSACTFLPRCTMLMLTYDVSVHACVFCSLVRAN
jgi:hypothetical protein